VVGREALELGERRVERIAKWVGAAKGLAQQDAALHSSEQGMSEGVGIGVLAEVTAVAHRLQTAAEQLE
jgi:hypothetical protein